MAMFIQLCMTGGTFMYSSYNKNPINATTAYCKAWYYLIQAHSYVGRWMLVAACLDRYILSSTNAILRRFATVRIARRVVLTIIFVWLVLMVPFIFLYDIKSDNCIIIYGYAAALYVGIFVIINTYVGPVSIMIICAFLIRLNLLKRRQRRDFIVDQQQRTNDKQRLEQKRDQQALVMLFAQIIIYIIVTTPWAIFGIYNAISLNIPNKSADRLVIEQFILVLSALIVHLFPATSFYTYTLTSNMFRRELFIMFCSVLRYQHFVNHARITPATVNIQ